MLHINILLFCNYNNFYYIFTGPVNNDDEKKHGILFIFIVCITSITIMVTCYTFTFHRFMYTTSEINTAMISIDRIKQLINHTEKGSFSQNSSINIQKELAAEVNHNETSSKFGKSLHIDLENMDISREVPEVVKTDMQLPCMIICVLSS